MEIYIPTTAKELSQRKLEEYAKFEKVIRLGRQNPIWFAEEFYGISLMDYQKWVFMESWARPFALWLCSRGAGKALSLDTKIPTPNGFTTMGDVKVGDYVIDYDGNPTKVISTSDIFYGHKCYKMTFSDGEEIISDANHLWTVSSKSCRQGRNTNADEFGLITLSADEIYKDYKYTRSDGYVEYNYQVPINKPIKYEEKVLPISPYVLGLWLGDGTKRNSHITCSENDIVEISQYIEDCGYETSIQYNKNRTPEIKITTGQAGIIGSNYVLTKLKDLDLYCNKHIPNDYMFASIQQRSELLQGLMDSDGTVDKRGHCSFSQKDYELIKQFSQLLSSLGIQHTIKKKTSSARGKVFESYIVSFYVTKDNPCFKLKRKFNRLKENKLLHSSTKVLVDMVETDSVPTKCIMVDNARSLFLCGERCTVTHNTVEAAVFLQTKMVLIPNYKVYVSTNSAAQSIEVFKKIEDLALQRIPSFKTCTDIFLHELDKSGNSETGFIHDPAGHRFRLFNNSELTTLSTNLNALRGKRGSVLYDETAWQTREQMSVTENFINVDSNFALGVGDTGKIDPVNMPLQLLYCSSAGDVTYPFYDKYKQFAMKMFMGDKNYFCCDLNAYTIMNCSSVNGVKIKSHLTEEQVQKSIDEDPDLAERELFNKFRKGGGQNAVVSMDCLIHNSTVRIPLLFNDTGKKKFIFCYDPARNFDGSVLSIFQVINDKELGYRLQLENSISMVDTESRNKTPLPMNEQLKIIKELMIEYNGERAAEWENIEFYIDAGSGGGGISAIADQLMEDWVDDKGIKHRGIIDPEHKQYETARKKYTNAMPIVHLIDPQGYKKIIYDALGKMTKLNLINFTEYDGKEYIMIEDKKEGYITYNLSMKEKLALTEINLLKTETSYMCRYDTPNGGVQYDLAKDKKNKMHDDRAYTLAMGAYALAVLRREDLLSKPKASNNHSSLLSMARKPSIIRTY